MSAPPVVNPQAEKRAAVGRGVVALALAAGNALIAVMIWSIGPWSGDGAWAMAVMAGSAATFALVAIPVAALNVAWNRSARPEGSRRGAADLLSILAVIALVAGVVLLLTRGVTTDLTAVGLLGPMILDGGILCVLTLTTRVKLRARATPAP